MNTLHTTTAKNTSNNERLILTIAGIVTALFCLVVLMREPHIAGSIGISVPKLLETSKVVAVNFVMEVTAWF